MEGKYLFHYVFMDMFLKKTWQCLKQLEIIHILKTNC